LVSEKEEMPDFDRKKFEECWRATEVIREYQRMLFTFGDMEVPYVLITEHSRFKDRAVITKGVVMLQRPQILLPSQYGGPQFQEGFEHADAIPPEAAFLLRAMQLPYSKISNRPVADEYMEYGSLQSVLDKFDREMESREDTETGLIKGPPRRGGCFTNEVFAGAGDQISTGKRQRIFRAPQTAEGRSHKAR